MSASSGHAGGGVFQNGGFNPVSPTKGHFMLLPFLIMFTFAPFSKPSKQEPPVASAMRQESAAGITHGVLALGADTFVLSGEGKDAFHVSPQHAGRLDAAQWQSASGRDERGRVPERRSGGNRSGRQSFVRVPGYAERSEHGTAAPAQSCSADGGGTEAAHTGTGSGAARSLPMFPSNARRTTCTCRRA